MKRNVLFLCSFNAGRSILAESLLNRFAGQEFAGYSAGEAPKPSIHPDAEALLKRMGHATEGLHPKSWREFLEPAAPQIDLAITLCNNAEGEMCMGLSDKFPIAHWDIPDPALAQSAEERATLFEQAYETLRHDILEMADLPETFVGQRFTNAVNRIGYSSAA